MTACGEQSGVLHPGRIRFMQELKGEWELSCSQLHDPQQLISSLSFNILLWDMGIRGPPHKGRK